MPFSTGTFSLFTPGNPVVTGTTISSSWANSTLSDIATGLSTAVLKDGTQTITANIPMSAFKLTGLGAGTTAGNSLRYEQLFNASGVSGLTLLNPANISQGLTDGATINWDTSLGAIATVTLGGSRIMAAPTNLKIGGFYSLTITQDGTGGRTLTWNGVFKGMGGFAMLQPQPTAAAVTNFFFVSDGTNLYLVGNPDGAYRTVQVFSATGTYTKPVGLKRAKITVVGGGGGSGGGNGAGSTSGGGGGGGTSIRTVIASSIGTTETVTVGTGGTAGTNAPTSGGTGNTSSFGSLASATGGSGSGGASAAGVTNGGVGGIGSSGDLNIKGASGMSGTAASQGGNGGSSSLGGGGLGKLDATPDAGGAYGGGAGGVRISGINSTGAVGADGVVFVEEFY